MPSYPTPHLYWPPIAINSQEGASHEPYFWQLLLISTPHFNVPSGCHIVIKHPNKDTSAGEVMKWPAAAILTCPLFTMMEAEGRSTTAIFSGKNYRQPIDLLLSI